MSSPFLLKFWNWVHCRITNCKFVQYPLHTSISEDRQGYAVIINTSLNVANLYDKAYSNSHGPAHVGLFFRMFPLCSLPGYSLSLYFEETPSVASKVDYHITSQNPLTLTLKKDWKYRDECQYLENITNLSPNTVKNWVWNENVIMG